MDLEIDARYDAFREEVRKFLAEHEPPRPFGMTEGKKEDRIAWLSRLIEHGYWARTIPKELSNRFPARGYHRNLTVRFRWRPPISKHRWTGSCGTSRRPRQRACRKNPCSLQRRAWP